MSNDHYAKENILTCT